MTTKDVGRASERLRRLRRQRRYQERLKELKAIQKDLRKATALSAKANRSEPQSVRQRLEKLFLKRSFQMLEDLSAKAPPDVLEEALGDPDPVGGVAGLLSKLVAAGARVEADPLLEAISRGVSQKRELLKEAGGTWSATQVAQALGISRQAVDKRRLRNALLAVPSASGDYLYPRCQFAEGGVIPHLEDVLQAFKVRNPWTRLSGLMAPAKSLGGSTVLEALHNGDVEGASAAARSIGDTLDEDAPLM